MTEEKYCKNCKRMVTPTPGANTIVFLLCILFFLIPGIIYAVWADGKEGKCPICGSENWGTPPGRKKKTETVVKKKFGRTTLVEAPVEETGFHPEKSDEDDPMIRYARGDITKEEFERLTGR